VRLLDKLRREELIPLGSRGLMTKELRHTLCDLATGNYRIFIGPTSGGCDRPVPRGVLPQLQKPLLRSNAPLVSRNRSARALQRPHAVAALSDPPF